MGSTLLHAQNSKSIKILYDNDVHCYAEGYPVMGGVGDSLRSQGYEVLTVSCGDYIFGNTLGVVSNGAYIVRLMNAVGYDYVTLGNHEFDYGIAQLKELQKLSKAEILCCNLVNHEGHRMMTSGVVRKIGGIGVGLIGVATPTTLTSCNPAYFRDSEGNILYNFCSTNLIEVVQGIADSLRGAGADVVIVLSHLGDSENAINSTLLIGKTRGIDAVLDGHDHHIIEQRWVANQEGEPVLLSSTGEHFNHIGVLTVSTFPNHKPIVSSQLLSTYPLHLTKCINKAVADTLAALLTGGADRQYFAHCDATLTAIDERGMRTARYQESSLGNLIADAYRIVTGAQIGWVNGGSIRANLDSGAISSNELMQVLPFQNQTVLGEVTGQEILDALEMGVRTLPTSSGGFAQVSGLSYEVNCTIPSSVVLDSTEIFHHVSGARRVYNVRIVSGEGSVALEADKIYTIASSSFTLCNHGDGIGFPHLHVVSKNFGTDAEVLEQYIKQHLGGKIDKTHAEPQGRIVVHSRDL